jgi:hypothetical protein
LRFFSTQGHEQYRNRRVNILIPSSTLRARGFPLHSPIALEEFDEQKYRNFVRTLSDETLIKEGKQLRWLSGDGKIVSTMPSPLSNRF